MASAAEAPFIARMSYGWTWSTDIGWETSWVSRCHPFGKRGRSGRSIMRAVRVAFSPALRLAAEEGAGDLARGVVLLLDVNGEGEEVHVAVVARGRGAEDHGVAGAHHDGAARLTGELSGLEGDLLAAYLNRDAGYVKHAHMSCSLRPSG